MGGILWSSHKNQPSTQQKQGQQGRFVSTMQFKSQSANELSEKDKMILDLKKVQDNLNRRIKQYESNIEECILKSKEFIKANNKTRAKYQLEKKVLFEKYISNILNQDHVITKTIRQVQDKFDQLETAKVLEKANILMKDLNKAIDVDGLQDALGNLQELEMNNKQFDELYAQYVGPESQEAQNQLLQFEADIFKDQLQNHEIVTEKPNIEQPYINQSQNQHKHNNHQQNQESKQDDIDDQLAMLA